MEHSALVAEIPFVERMPLSDRLRHAKKRRAQQLKAYTQREKRLVKESSLTGKRSGKRGSDTTTPTSEEVGRQSRLQFVDGVLMMEAVIRSDTKEGGCCFLFAVCFISPPENDSFRKDLCFTHDVFSLARSPRCVGRPA